MRFRYKLMAVNRPVIIKRGWEGEIESNQTNAYLGEWVSFKLPLTEDSHAELRMPVEEALDQGLIIAADRIRLYDDDYVDDEGE